MRTAPDEAEITRYITESFDRVEIDHAYGYTMFFYGGDRRLPFATIAAQNNEFDRVSDLDRPGVFRLNIGVPREKYRSLLGATPSPPGPGGIIETGHDFAALDQLMPHPHYGNMNWVCVLNPSTTTYAAMRELLAEACALARQRNERRTSR